MDRRLQVFYLVLVFLIGFASLIYQIYCIRVLFLFFVEHTQAVSISISSFIAGLAVSSLIFSQLSSKKQRNRKLIFYMQLAAAVYGLFFLTNYELIPQLLDFLYRNLENDFLISCFKLAIMWAYLFIPAFFIGGAFPLINGLYLSDADMASEETGIVYFWDMMGAITGSLFAGFFLIPYVGIYGTVMVPVTINLFVAVLLSESRKVYEGILRDY